MDHKCGLGRVCHIVSNTVFYESMATSKDFLRLRGAEAGGSSSALAWWLLTEVTG